MPSKSGKQHRFMEMVAHDPGAAKRVGVPQSVGEDFSQADKGKSFADDGKKIGNDGKHPGFAAVQKKIEGEGYSKESAGAILASKSRHASPAAKKANPRLNKVIGHDGKPCGTCERIYGEEE